MSETYPVQGAGLGLRRAFIGSLAVKVTTQIFYTDKERKQYVYSHMYCQ